MSVRIRLTMAALTAVFALAFAADTGFALRSLSLSGLERETRLTGAVTFRAVGRAAEVICNTTFEKTLSSVFPKTTGVLIGKVTRIDIQRPEMCRIAGTEIEQLRAIRILGIEREELWRIFYVSILGTLPRITGALFEIRNILAELEFKSLGIELRCLYASNLGVLAEVREEVIHRLRTLANSINATGTFGCPRGEFRAELTPTANIVVHLI